VALSLGLRRQNEVATALFTRSIAVSPLRFRGAPKRTSATAAATALQNIVETAEFHRSVAVSVFSYTLTA